MSRLAVGWIVIGILAGSIVSKADSPSSKANSELMQRKLAASQVLLTGLAKEDYAQLSKNSDQLLKLAKQEWIADDTPEYRAHLKDFWVVVEGIKSSADEKNLDGATLGYVQMTISCVKCHKYLRSRTE